MAMIGAGIGVVAVAGQAHAATSTRAAAGSSCDRPLVYRIAPSTAATMFAPVPEKPAIDAAHPWLSVTTHDSSYHVEERGAEMFNEAFTEKRWWVWRPARGDVRICRAMAGSRIVGGADGGAAAATHSGGITSTATQGIGFSQFLPLGELKIEYARVARRPTAGRSCSRPVRLTVPARRPQSGVQFRAGSSVAVPMRPPASPYALPTNRDPGYRQTWIVRPVVAGVRICEVIERLADGTVKRIPRPRRLLRTRTYFASNPLVAFTVSVAGAASRSPRVSRRLSPE